MLKHQDVIRLEGLLNFRYEAMLDVGDLEEENIFPHNKENLSSRRASSPGAPSVAPLSSNNFLSNTLLASTPSSTSSNAETSQHLNVMLKHVAESAVTDSQKATEVWLLLVGCSLSPLTFYIEKDITRRRRRRR